MGAFKVGVKGLMQGEGFEGERAMIKLSGLALGRAL